VRVLDFKNALTPLLTSRANLAEIRGLRFTRELIAESFNDYGTGFINQWNPFTTRVDPAMLQNTLRNLPFAYNADEFVPISDNARNDVRTLLHYVDVPRCVRYYDTL